MMDGSNPGFLVAVFGLGVQEMLLILLAIVFLFGAKKIPEIARGLGKGMSEFKKGISEGQDEGDKQQKDKPSPPASE
ncbi:MAG: twin-arginine translocase TatA/TatE family subunit [Candidatus Zixiibacteriota bacterium]